MQKDLAGLTSKHKELTERNSRNFRAGKQIQERLTKVQAEKTQLEAEKDALQVSTYSAGLEAGMATFASDSFMQILNADLVTLLEVGSATEWQPQFSTRCPAMLYTCMQGRVFGIAQSQ